MRPHVIPYVAILAATLTVGCRGAGGPESFTVPGGMDVVELHVWNRSVRTITVYAWWGSSRVPLGQVPANERRVFNSPRRAAIVALSWAATSGAQRTNQRRCAAEVQPGDRIEWTIQNRRCSFIQLDPVL